MFKIKIIYNVIFNLFWFELLFGSFFLFLGVDVVIGFNIGFWIIGVELVIGFFIIFFFEL